MAQGLAGGPFGQAMEDGAIYFCQTRAKQVVTGTMYFFLYLACGMSVP